MQVTYSFCIRRRKKPPSKECQSKSIAYFTIGQHENEPQTHKSKAYLRCFLGSIAAFLIARCAAGAADEAGGRAILLLLVVALSDVKTGLSSNPHVSTKVLKYTFRSLEFTFLPLGFAYFSRQVLSNKISHFLIHLTQGILRLLFPFFHSDNETSL